MKILKLSFIQPLLRRTGAESPTNHPLTHPLSIRLVGYYRNRSHKIMMTIVMFMMVYRLFDDDDDDINQDTAILMNVKGLWVAAARYVPLNTCH